jgi:hypothetical protein
LLIAALQRSHFVNQDDHLTILAHTCLSSIKAIEKQFLDWAGAKAAQLQTRDRLQGRLHAVIEATIAGRLRLGADGFRREGAS